VSGAFIDNNAYAIGTAMAMFLFFGVALAVPWRAARWAMVAGASLGAMTVVSLFSRGGLLALAAGTVTFIALQRRVLGIVIGVLLVVGAVIYLPRPQGYEERISPLTGETAISQDLSVESRLHFWRTALDMAMARPFGVGLWNYAEAYDRFDSSHGAYGPKRAVHNSPLQMLAETGFAGFAGYMFLLGWSVRILFKVRARGKDMTLPADERAVSSHVANGAIASTVAFFIGGSTISLALNDLTWFTFGAVIALDRMSGYRTAASAAATPASITLSSGR
jgi:O-antigen ligase